MFWGLALAATLVVVITSTTLAADRMVVMEEFTATW